MFREMRRKKQELSAADTAAVFERATSGVLAVSGDDGYPYTVPISFIYCGSKIYFHCAKAGHKIDAIRQNNKVSFCVIDSDCVHPEKFTTYFRSAIAFGKARIIEDTAEKRAALEFLAAKYTPDDADGRRKEIDGSIERVCIIELEIEHMTGKEAIELVNMK